MDLAMLARALADDLAAVELRVSVLAEMREPREAALREELQAVASVARGAQVSAVVLAALLAPEPDRARPVDADAGT